MFTVWIKPQNGEALSGFLMRFAQSNGIDVLTIWNLIKTNNFGTPQVSDIHLIDFTPHSVINIELLSTLTQIQTQTLLSMTFYNVLVQYGHNEKIYTSRIMRGVIRRSLHYCPLCMKEKAYLLLFWKIEGIDICLKHQCYLNTTCSFCNETIMLSSVYLGRIDCCPKCMSELNKHQYQVIADHQILGKQKWLFHAWEDLLETQEHYIIPSDLAQRLLFILNDEISDYDYKNLIEFCSDKGIKFQSLLQCARDSQKQKRAVHITQILRICFLKDKLPKELININVPDSFQSQLLKLSKRVENTPVCLAPWCTSYSKGRSLIKMGTQHKRLSSGKIYKKQFACKECGCQYVYDEEGKQIEKHHFIIGYEVLSHEPSLSLTEIINRLVLPVTKCRKIVAYFKARNGNTIWDNNLLENLLIGVKNNIRSAEIKKWSCWDNSDHFLVYYHHVDVMKERILSKKQNGPRISWPHKMLKLELICQELLQLNENITISSISSMIDVSDKTIRKWPEAYSLIQQYKKLQKETRLNHWVNEIYTKVNDYIQNYMGERLLSKDVYSHIGVKQSYLVKKAPEINEYIYSKRREYLDNTV